MYEYEPSYRHFSSLELSLYSRRVHVYVKTMIMPQIRGIMIYLLLSPKEINYIQFINVDFFLSLVIKRYSQALLKVMFYSRRNATGKKTP